MGEGVPKKRIHVEVPGRSDQQSDRQRAEHDPADQISPSGEGEPDCKDEQGQQCNERFTEQRQPKRNTGKNNRPAAAAANGDRN